MRTTQVVAQIPYLMTVAWAAGLDAASFLQVAANGGATDAGQTAPVKELGEAALDFMKEQGDLMKEQMEFMKEQGRILADIVEMKKEEDHEGGREPPVEGGVTRKGRASSDGSLEAGEEEVVEQEKAHAAQNRTQVVEHIAEGRVLGEINQSDPWASTAVAVLDLAATDPALKGFYGGFTDGTYGYAVPLNNGAYSGKVARFDLAGFAAVASLDLAATDPALKAFVAGFADGTYGYALPYHNGAYSGKVARFGVSAAANDPGDQTSVVGDPHVVNVAKVKFEIRTAGVHKLVQIPQVIRSNEKPDLRVDAEIQHLASHDCDKSFLTSLTVFGQWTEDIFGLLRISPGSDAPNTSLLVHTQFARPEVIPRPEVKAGRHSLTFKLRDVAFHVGKHYEGRYGKQRAYLNVRIAGLKKYKDLGGLLGYDDHGDAEKPSADCAAAQPPPASRSSFVGSGRSAPGTAGGSRIEAE